jgi:hypothetical protein
MAYKHIFQVQCQASVLRQKTFKTSLLGKAFKNSYGQDLPRDLSIIMDSSYSICSVGFQVAKDQTSKLIGLLCPNSSFDKIAGSPYQYNQAIRLTYSTNVVENFDFNTYSTIVSIQKALKSL